LLRERKRLLGVGILYKIVKVDIMNQHQTRMGVPSIFTKSIGITPEDLKYIDFVRGRKSKAGKLKEIISVYKSKK